MAQHSWKDHGWVIDRTVKRITGGTPPAGHFRRCQGKVRSGTQCPHWATKTSNRGDGSGYCIRHGGRRPKYKLARSVGFYTREAGETLKARMAELSQIGPEERLRLDEEIDLARVMCGRAVSIYEGAVLNPETAEKASPSTKALAASHLRSALDHVSTIVKRAVDVREKLGGSIRLEDVNWLVEQIVEVVEREVADVSRPMADRVIAGVRGIKLPVADKSAEASAEDIRNSLAAMKSIDEAGAPEADVA